MLYENFLSTDNIKWIFPKYREDSCTYRLLHALDSETIVYSRIVLSKKRGPIGGHRHVARARACCSICRTQTRLCGSLIK